MHGADSISSRALPRDFSGHDDACLWLARMTLRLMPAPFVVAAVVVERVVDKFTDRIAWRHYTVPNGTRRRIGAR